MVIREGSELDDEKIRASRIRLLQTGAFSDVQVETT